MDYFEELAKEQLKNHRINEQSINNDYNEDKEKCQTCGNFLNSHDHCPLCDY